MTIETRFYGPTNHRGARVSARLPSGAKVTIAWDYAIGVTENHDRAAIALARKALAIANGQTDVAIATVDLVRGEAPSGRGWVYVRRTFGANTLTVTVSL